MDAPRHDRSFGVQRLGFGVSGPQGSPLVSYRATEALIMRAYELGVRLFDTGPSYGNGEAERRLGEVMSRLPPSDCIISTKVGISSYGLMGRRRDFSPDAIRRSLDGSMKRLKAHRLDWVFLHGPAPSELTDALFKTMEAEQKSGRVGVLGLAGRGSEIDAAINTGLFRVFMAPVHSGLTPESLARLKRIKASGAELIGIEVLAASLSPTPLPTGTGSLWRFMRGVAGRGTRPPPRRVPVHQAIQWALTTGGAHRIVSTTTRVERLEQNVISAREAPELP
jgi:aryl-alcohol dehydrogenase-like predicted oxidoreductase